MPWNGLKIEIYDFHQYICSPEKVFPYELEPLGSLLSPIFGHTYSKWNFTIQGVLKMKNAIKLANNSDVWLQSINLLSTKSFPFWGGFFLEPFVPNI